MNRSVSSPAKAQQWTRRRGVLATFSVVASLGFGAAVVVPTVSAIATGGPDVVVAEAPMTAYGEAVAGAQSLTASETVVSGEVARGEYEVFVTPTPTPTPTVEPASSGKSGSGSTYVPRYNGGGSPAEWMAAAGIAEADFGYVDYIVSRESGWNPNATNSSSGACGLVQAYPCSKVPGGGYNPIANLKWANGYATGRYGSWASAYNFWTSNHWW